MGALAAHDSPAPSGQVFSFRPWVTSATHAPSRSSPSWRIAGRHADSGSARIASRTGSVRSRPPKKLMRAARSSSVRSWVAAALSVEASDDEQRPPKRPQRPLLDGPLDEHDVPPATSRVIDSSTERRSHVATKPAIASTLTRPPASCTIRASRGLTASAIEQASSHAGRSDTRPRRAGWRKLYRVTGTALYRMRGTARSRWAAREAGRRAARSGAATRGRGGRRCTRRCRGGR